MDPCYTSKEDDLDLLGDDVEAFSGSQADLEGAAENLFSSPQTVPPTPGTALQNKIESRLEKSLGSQFNIQLQQQTGVFKASMLEAMKSLRDEMHSMKKPPSRMLFRRPTLYLKLDPANSLTRLRLGLQFPRLGHPTTRMLNQ